jgi:hypothetical protein
MVPPFDAGALAHPSLEIVCVMERPKLPRRHLTAPGSG